MDRQRGTKTDEIGHVKPSVCPVQARSGNINFSQFGVALLLPISARKAHTAYHQTLTCKCEVRIVFPLEVPVTADCATLLDHIKDTLSASPVSLGSISRSRS
jgi:hypothetical protein